MGLDIKQVGPSGLPRYIPVKDKECDKCGEPMSLDTQHPDKGEEDFAIVVCQACGAGMAKEDDA